MNRICPRCHTVYSYASKECPNKCNAKQKYERNKVYDKCQRKNHDFYNSKEWKFLREACKNKFSGICIWTYYKYKKIVHGEVAHHIIPVSVSKDLSLSLSNLIYLSEDAHREIHMNYYVEGCRNVEEFNLVNEGILKDIYDCIKKWNEQDEGVGV